ncbi:cytochrome c1 [Aquabacterium sp. OR-4]|uniref:cytochrome c1 n=1 Tax=Aquabacterium sp. OR-4 TaxID=2978127 RepID=UPI0021B34261|nr:cytochrome c1 [Aquabacterium sp. OR-4]MDT7835949.1 cytochrome c1 [Aquabacterium sp. OR-4]
MKRIIAGLLAALSLCTTALASGDAGPAWDKFPKERVTDVASLQNGAKLFVNYCLNCHAAAFMRFNRLRDIGLTEDQIKKNMLFPTEKVGDLMTVALNAKDAKDWFGATPPDLTVIARSRAGANGSGADYLYTYMRTFYRDETKATGWNNLVFPSVGMPHVLWQLQGEQRAVFADEKDPHDATRTVHVFKGFEQTKPGQLNKADYDAAMADLVGYLQWMGEPAQNQRARLGVWVLLFLAVFTTIAWRLNAAYWKDVK